jgi:hypothetical protein
MKGTARAVVDLTIAAGALCVVPAQAAPIQYVVDAEVANFRIGNATCGVRCQIRMTATADTGDVKPYSVCDAPGNCATGFKNTNLGTVHVALHDGGLNLSWEADLPPAAGLYFSVDSDHGGIGFGSTLVTPSGQIYGPTYPLALYGINLQSYQLTTALSGSGYSGFCPGPPGFACDNDPHPPMLTTDNRIFAVGLLDTSMFHRGQVEVTLVNAMPVAREPGKK